MPDTVDLSKLICPAFYPVHESIWDNDHSEYWLVGGRGSTKSSFVAIQIILGIITDPNANAVCLRKVKDTVRNSIMPTLLWAIDVLGATDQFSHIKSPTEITYIPTGQKIIMTGLDDPTKLKSIKTIKGYLKYLWFEEANQFHGMEEIRNVEQSIIRGGKNFVEFITYNPPNDPAAWVNKEIKNEYPDRYVHTSSYLEVSPEWLGEDFFKKANRLREFDPIKYAHEYLGQVVGRAEQIIFFGKWEIKEFDTHPIDEIYEKRFFYGCDWGFASDPTAVGRQYITVQNGKRYLWIEYEAGGVGIEFEQLSQLFDSIPDIRNWKIYADSARPETISYMQRQGFRIEAAEKWKGSVEDGIEYLKSFDKIYVHPRCKQSIEEFTKYSYKVDRITQEILPVIVDDHNHFIDACIAEGQLIATSKGLIPIEQIGVGDFVLTRDGYKPVEQKVMTGVKRLWEVKVGNYTLLATDNHNVYTQKGFTRVDALRYGDSCLIIKGNAQCLKLKLKNLREKFIAAIPKAKISAIELILKKAIHSATQRICTEMFGKAITAKFRKGITSIILTATQQIMRSKILSAFLQASTCQSIIKWIKTASVIENNLFICKKLTSLQRLGTQRLKGWRVIAKMGRKLGKILFQFKNNVSTAKRIFFLKSLAIVTCFAQMLANRRGEERKNLIILKSFAMFVKSILWRINMLGQKPVPALVASVQETNRFVRVYDIAVKDSPEFFASGVLVHNCRYALSDYIKKQPQGFFDMI